MIEAPRLIKGDRGKEQWHGNQDLAQARDGAMSCYAQSGFINTTTFVM